MEQFGYDHRDGHTQGYFTVRNGAVYDSLTHVSYSNGTFYHFRIIPDFSANTYTVYVTPQGGTETMIAQNYAFRSDAPATDDLGQIVLKSDSDNAYKVENHRVIWPTQSAWSAGTKSLGTGNTGVLTTEFDLTPVDSTVNGTIGYADSSTTVNDWSSPAMTIAMDRTQGYFTVRNGTVYDCLTQVPYSNGTKYHFRIAVNFTADTYTVFVTPEGGTETMIAKDYEFRSDAPATDDLGRIYRIRTASTSWKIIPLHRNERRTQGNARVETTVPAAEHACLAAGFPV